MTVELGRSIRRGRAAAADLIVNLCVLLCRTSRGASPRRDTYYEDGNQKRGGTLRGLRIKRVRTTSPVTTEILVCVESAIIPIICQGISGRRSHPKKRG
jgi:hypothetical protein